MIDTAWITCVSDRFGIYSLSLSGPSSSQCRSNIEEIGSENLSITVLLLPPKGVSYESAKEFKSLEERICIGNFDIVELQMIRDAIIDKIGLD